MLAFHTSFSLYFDTRTKQSSRSHNRLPFFFLLNSILPSSALRLPKCLPFPPQLQIGLPRTRHTRQHFHLRRLQLPRPCRARLLLPRARWFLPTLRLLLLLLLISPSSRRQPTRPSKVLPRCTAAHAQVCPFTILTYTSLSHGDAPAGHEARFCTL